MFAFDLFLLTADFTAMLFTFASFMTKWPATSVIAMLAAFVAGIVLTVSYTFMPSVAPWYSQMIHDCGVRVAGEGATVEKMIGIRVDGHKYAVCWPD